MCLLVLARSKVACTRTFSPGNFTENFRRRCSAAAGTAECPPGEAKLKSFRFTTGGTASALARQTIVRLFTVRVSYIAVREQFRDDRSVIGTRFLWVSWKTRPIKNPSFQCHRFSFGAKSVWSQCRDRTGCIAQLACDVHRTYNYRRKSICSIPLFAFTEE